MLQKDKLLPQLTRSKKTGIYYTNIEVLWSHITELVSFRFHISFNIKQKIVAFAFGKSLCKKDNLELMIRIKAADSWSESKIGPASKDLLMNV